MEKRRNSDRKRRISASIRQLPCRFQSSFACGVPDGLRNSVSCLCGHPSIGIPSLSHSTFCIQTSYFSKEMNISSKSRYNTASYKNILSFHTIPSLYILSNNITLLYYTFFLISTNFFQFNIFLILQLNINLLDFKNLLK